MVKNFSTQGCCVSGELNQLQAVENHKSAHFTNLPPNLKGSLDFCLSEESLLTSIEIINSYKIMFLLLIKWSVINSHNFVSAPVS